MLRYQKLTETKVNNNLQELIHAGNDILKSVTDAVDQNNYSALASNIGNIVKSVDITSPPKLQGRSASFVNVKYTPPMKAVEKPNYFLMKKPSRQTGIPQMVISGTLGVITGIAAISEIVAGSIIAAVAAGIAFTASGIIFLKNNQKNNLVNRFYQYGDNVGSEEYFSIRQLAGAVMRTDKEIIKDLKAMIKQGFLPRARIDTENTTCMLTDNAYNLYLDSVKAREERVRHEEDIKKLEAKENKKKKHNDDNENLPANVREILDEGSEYISYIRYVNDIIPDTEEMSNKLYRLENIMNRIFSQVKKQPETADELQKLMNYYLPTTKKLLGAYIELDKQPAVGDNITRTKLEIDSAMDTINEAYENLLNSLFQDMAWDISSDISVMKTMLAQDGLTDNKIAK